VSPSTKFAFFLEEDDEDSFDKEFQKEEEFEDSFNVQRIQFLHQFMILVSMMKIFFI
jgi:hypothetical protein